MTVKGFFKGAAEFFCYLFRLPSGGSERRTEQQAYEDRLDEAMSRARAEKES